MAKSTTPTILQSTQMTRRQQLNRRIELDEVSGKLLNRLAKFALGEEEEVIVWGEEKRRKGQKLEIIIQKCEMTIAEIRAAEIVLRKCVPDLAAQILVIPDNDNLSREELAERIKVLAMNNPQLALVAGLDIVIDKAKTVATIEKSD